MVSEKYNQRYALVFQGDISFSRKFMPQVEEILSSIALPQTIRDNEGTELNGRGSDLTIMPLQVGVRVRRAAYRGYDEFTQDDKERRKMSCDIYFLGYANKSETRLTSYMAWNGKEYEQLRGTALIPRRDRKQNRAHSLVWFNCYSNSDIADNCTVYALQGKIAGRFCPAPLSALLDTIPPS